MSKLKRTPGRRPRKGDWVVFDAKTQSFFCERCEARYKPALPVPVAMFASMGKEFVKLHKSCQPGARRAT